MSTEEPPANLREATDQLSNAYEKFGVAFGTELSIQDRAPARVSAAIAMRIAIDNWLDLLDRTTEALAKESAFTKEPKGPTDGDG